MQKRRPDSLGQALQAKHGYHVTILYELAVHLGLAAAAAGLAEAHAHGPAVGARVPLPLAFVWCVSAHAAAEEKMR